MTRLLTLPLLLVLATTPLGCAKGDPSISGEVTYDGSPVEKGSISLSPVGGSGSPAGGAIQNGNYTIDKVSVGKYMVSFSAKKLPDEQPTSEKSVRAVETIPSDAVGNGQEVEIVPGAQKMDFHLKPPQ